MENGLTVPIGLTGSRADRSRCNPTLLGDGHWVEKLHLHWFNHKPREQEAYPLRLSGVTHAKERFIY